MGPPLSVCIEFKALDCDPAKFTDKAPVETVSHLQYAGLDIRQPNSLFSTIKQRTDETILTQ